MMVQVVVAEGWMAVADWGRAVAGLEADLGWMARDEAAVAGSGWAAAGLEMAAAAGSGWALEAG